MTSVGRSVAIGAVWMIGARLLDRSIGFVSTLVLARLLVPADFGLVAMAMAVFAFIEVGGQFGFDMALIRERQATREHYDSAWTLQVGYALFTGCALAALALPSAAYFNEPRLTAVMLVLAAVALVQGFENIGTVDFRKDFRYGKDFQLMFTKRVTSFVITLALALTFRSYWALLGGMAASRGSGVLLSYLLHPFRPRLSFAKTRELMRFSRWIVLRGLVDYLIERGPDFLIGRFIGTSGLGLYRVSREISTLPTTELIFPMMRAVFPGYAAVAHDRRLLAQSFLSVQGTIIMLALPAGVGIVLLAEPIVHLLLGPKWLETIPLIRILGLYGAVAVFQATNMSIFNVLGMPRWGATLKAVEVALLLPGLALVFYTGHGLVEAAWTIFAAQALVIPVGMALIQRLLAVSFKERIAVSWRPLLGTAAMAAALLAQGWAPPAGAGGAALQLGASVALGAAAFLSTVFVLWRLAGAPDGPERHFVTLLRQRFPARNPAAPEAP